MLNFIFIQAEKLKEEVREKTMPKHGQSQYIAVSLESLVAGMLIERPLYVYFQSNDRYILLAKPLHTLESRVLSKFVALGKVFTTEASVDERVRGFSNGVEAVREMCTSDALAPFEKNRAIREATRFLVSEALSLNSKSMTAVFFMHRIFGVPKPKTLQYVSDLSVEMYEQCLRMSALAGLIALWLGYSDTKFIAQFIESVFCEQISAYQENAKAEQKSEAYAKASFGLILKGNVPEVEALDHRFGCLMTLRANAKAAGDELVEILEYARWLTGVSTVAQTTIAKSRIARKLTMIFDPADQLTRKEAA